jgi:hypothetical protein
MNNVIDISIPTESEYAELYKGDEFVGIITTELQLFSIRVQIAKMKLDNCYIFWVDKECIPYYIDITIDGHLSDYPRNFFDLFDNYLLNLLEEQGNLFS